ncbi:MAG: MoaD/ThiS family protein [Gemmatimonadota bacterium]|nr:MoaD/ThiS family protein [Gemmatimonadota bacterium]MDE3129273.1 MoaD/ThiS family protein [Gemmatimonadota bacterium]MDE3171971.1 MoaD/ThiS family protein [Gemmatimonadota bacterium]MDE3216091.1 MoaD/ThiS family protein [Gemmatimonadota bacterium]
MPLRVLLFASYADALGASEVDVTLPANATVRDVVAQLRARGGAERLPPAPLVAVNQRYAGPDTPVSERDEVAVIPPVAGG